MLVSDHLSADEPNEVSSQLQQAVALLAKGALRAVGQTPDQPSVQPPVQPTAPDSPALALAAANRRRKS